MADNHTRELFGTDGIRGQANVHPMTPEVALQLGRAVAHIFRGTHAHPRIVIGKDTRLSNYMFETAIQAGICSMGVDAVQLGVLPTPGIAFMTSGMRADAGVVISASHNPYDDNGIKFFAADGFKLPDEVEAQIERLVQGGRLDDHRALGRDIGRAYRIHDAGGRYCVFLKSTFPKDLSLEGLKVVVDCGNGAAYKVAPEVLYELGADVTSLGVTPDGTNINEGCGALHPELMAAAVREHGADLGIALDGDADRVFLCDETGRIVDGDAILGILGDHLARLGQLTAGTVVATVMSNLGLERALNSRGLRLERTAVGDRYVVERMKAGGFTLGGEQSGHILLLDHTTTGDGLLTALQVMAIVARTGKPLSELARIVEPVPQVLRGVMVRAKPPLESLDEVARAIASAEGTLGSCGRVLVRYSGTENKCRVMLEGDDDGAIARLADDIVGAIERAIGRREEHEGAS
ncbi:MAG: phosphoglucosamine mutase [Deltaproteobacteria bacterium]|nr:phosphoglucosamine mutase [Deltaproteobacteria bacterium]